jgi:hypothetical protein
MPVPRGSRDTGDACYSQEAAGAPVSLFDAHPQVDERHIALSQPVQMAALRAASSEARNTNAVPEQLRTDSVRGAGPPL